MNAALVAKTAYRDDGFETDSSAEPRAIAWAILAEFEDRVSWIIHKGTEPSVAILEALAEMRMEIK